MNSKSKTAPDAPLGKTPPPPPVHVPPLFRRLDWFSMLIAFGIVWGVYLICLAPQVTLEDSGELTTASYWAGIPHPPGYPFWTIYTWLWTVLVPFGNIAWRVELAESFTAALGCGVLALMVSRGSSMLMEGINDLKGVVGKWEGAICMVSGVAAALLLGFGSSMWYESVVINRISLFGTPMLMLVMVFLMRWTYAPHQRKYLYIAMFFLGVCCTIHQTLFLASMGIEIGIAMVSLRLGRNLFAVNSLFFLVGLLGKIGGAFPALANAEPMVFNIFMFVGITSLVVCVWLTIKTGEFFTEWGPIFIMGAVALIGVSFYFYEALAGMTNPPMEWGYPRTVEGFWHALSRGQYDKVHPTDIFAEPKHFYFELKYLVGGVAVAFSWVFMFFAFIPFFFYRRMQKRERSWIVMVAAVYPFLGVMLSIFLNPTPDRQMSDLVKVFFISSHAIYAIMVGYGMALAAAAMAADYARFRFWGLVGAGVAFCLAIYNLYSTTVIHFFGLDGSLGFFEMFSWIGKAFAPEQYGSPVFAALILLVMTVVFAVALGVYKTRAPLFILLALYCVTPVYASLMNWFHAEQTHHWFGYWFGHDMFTPPFVGPDDKLTYDAQLRDAAAKGKYGKMVYPEMARDAVLYGGTDPGRFCPTYMIFCESFIPHSCQPKQDQHFDRRDVYIITQNALADNTYLDYIRAQFNRSTQIDPPFFQNFLSGTLPNVFHGRTATLAWLDDIFESLGGRIEFRRRTSTSFFAPDEFSNAEDFAAKLHAQQTPLSKYLYGTLTPETKSLVDNPGKDKSLARALSKDLNSVLTNGTIYDPERFKGIHLPQMIVDAMGHNNIPATLIRLNRRMLEEAYPQDIVKSLGGVYPDTEIQTPSPDDSQQCFNDYISDAGRRLQHDMQFPNEPHQVRPGEDVHVDNGRVQVSGQVAVMAINGLLTKVIFDKNPLHEFYVEESFPLDWMYPYLTPFGVIMKINREPIAELSQETIDKDHAFWSEFSRRTIGNWITYDTSISNICAWAEDTYLRHNFAHFTGDRSFVRDDDGQKAFSKLRSSIAASIYLWRSRPQNSHSAAERARVTKEAEFALKQAFAFCPFSPEVVFHLMDLLLTQNRLDDAIAVLKTCHSLDPYNDQINSWIEQLEKSKGAGAGAGGPAASVQDKVRQAISQAAQAAESKQSNVADQILNSVMGVQGLTMEAYMQIAQIYLTINDSVHSEEAIRRIISQEPDSSQAYFNLAIIQIHQMKVQASVDSLKKAFDLNAVELKKGAKVPNLRNEVFNDQRLQPWRDTPEFKKAFPNGKS